jgi:cytochrome oxidase Cu insertion factor (SCO1/SenC/PrrC family)
MKLVNNKYFILGHNEIIYRGICDTVILTANLLLDITNLDLRLDFVKGTFPNYDTNKMIRTYLPSYNVGTFLKPNKKMIKSLLKDNKIKNRSFITNRWITDYSSACTLAEMLSDISNKDILIMRAIKLMKIKRMLAKKRI